MRRLLLLALSIPLSLLGCGGNKVHPTAAAAQVRYTDVTREAGIDFIQRHGGCGKSYFVEQTGGGVALFDMDGDGDLDLYFPQGTWLPGCKGTAPLQAHLFRNDGKGHFEEVPGAGGATCSDYGIGTALGDYDGDGRLDLFVSCYGHSHLFRNLGGGRFQDVTAAAHLNRVGYSTSATWLDYDRDGKLDLFVCGYVDWNPNSPVRCPAADGRPDYCTPQAFPPGRNALFHNRGDGTFEDVTVAAGLNLAHDRALGVVAADLDGDGWTDLFVANDAGANMLFRNLHDGRFADEAMVRAVAYGASGKAQSNMGLAVADYDRDGDPDVLVTTFADEPFTLYQNQGAYFKDVSAPCGLAEPTYVPLGFGVALLDVDQDGWDDAFFANGHVEQYINQRSHTQTFAQANQLFLGGPDGKFTQHSEALPKDDVRVHRSIACGDIDGDGDLDLIVTSLDGRPTVLRNDSHGGHWLTVAVADRGGSLSAVGARVRITVGGSVRTGWVMGGGGYLGQSDYAVHFGLGTSAQADRVEVDWITGEHLVVNSVKADQRLVVHPPRP